MIQADEISLETKALTSVWPADGSVLNLKQTIETAGHTTLADDISATLRSLKTAQKLSKHPILAVTGQLNSGKSSVVASFLSATGRERVPRGSSSATGTHRFVYWVPQLWLNDPTYKSLLLDLIATAHPDGVEFLDTDPEKAAEQYRSGRDNLDTLSIPLIAGDTHLDKLGAGLLDCPDIQTHDSSDTEKGLTESDNPRLDFLTAASRVCSAFLVVWSRAAIRDRLIEIMLNALRKRMASAPLYLLINLIRPEKGQPALTMSDSDVTRLLEQFNIAPNHVYGAFDYAIEDRSNRPGWRHFTPIKLIEKFNKSEGPQFYPLAEGIKSTEDLHSLSQSLDTAEIQRIKIEDHRNELNSHLSDAKKLIRKWVTDEEQEIIEKYDGLLSTCQAMMTDESSGEPLQIMSPEFAEALHQSILRTAPMALRLPLKLAKPFDKALNSSKKFIGSLNLKSFAKDKVEDLEGELKQHLKLGSIKLASSESLARRMQTQRWCPADIEVEDLEKAWNEVFLVFQKHPIETFDNELLDESSKDYWDGFTLMQKFTIGGKALLGTLGGLAAVCGIATLAVDGGATFYAATSVSHAINSGIALAVTAGGSAAAMVSFKDTLLKDNTLPYLSRLFSIACDSFRLPREIPAHPATVNFRDPNGKKTTHKVSTSTDLPHFKSITPLTNNNLWENHISQSEQN